MEVDLGQATLYSRDPASPKMWHNTPYFSADVCCGHMAAWIKMTLGTEVDLGPGHIVLDGDPASPRKGHCTAPFSAHVHCDQTVAHLSYC